DRVRRQELREQRDQIQDYQDDAAEDAGLGAAEAAPGELHVRSTLARLRGRRALGGWASGDRWGCGPKRPLLAAGWLPAGWLPADGHLVGAVGAALVVSHRGFISHSGSAGRPRRGPDRPGGCRR